MVNKGFYIQVENGLLADGHRKKMGSAVWEFMWLLDSITSINKTGEGLILGGRPLHLAEIAEDMEISENTVSDNLSKLEDEGYISITRAPYGLVVKVAKAKKRFKVNSTSKGTKENSISRSENSISNIRQDSRQDSKTITAAPFVLKDELEKLKGSPQNHIRLIGEYLEEIGFTTSSKCAFDVAWKRHLRDAVALSRFTDQEIGRATEYAQREYKKVGYTLGTLVKIITSNLYAKK